MSRYIDADALIESICHTADLGGWIGDTLRQIKRLAVRYINSAPSIDIVRCRECKYWKESQYYPKVMVCTYVKGATFTRQHDDFCSRGEREGE